MLLLVLMSTWALSYSYSWVDARVPQYSGKRLVLCIIRIFIILCINTKNTSELLQVRARGTREGGGMVPASKYVMQGQLLGAKQRKPICFRRQANTNFPARSCVCVSIQSATPCIISIQSATPCIVYYTYFYLFFIMPYFLLWNPGCGAFLRREGPERAGNRLS